MFAIRIGTEYGTWILRFEPPLVAEDVKPAESTKNQHHRLTRPAKKSEGKKCPLLFTPFRKIASVFPRYFKTTARFHEEPRYKEKVSLRAVLQTRNWFRWNIELFYNWFLTRPYGDLVLGLPAILAMFGVLYLFGQANPKQHQRVNSLSGILKTTYSAKDNTAVELCLRSLLQVKPERADFQVARAVALTALERKEEAIESMKELYLQTSSTRAAFWLATNTLALNQLREWTLEQHNVFRDYMKAALSSSDGWNIDDREIVMAKYLVGMDAVFDIAMECRKSSDPEVRNLLTQTVQSVDPHVLHMLRGTIAAMDGDLDKAIYHLKTAEPSATSLPVIYSNLAVAISSKSDANLLEALRLVELAILGDSKQFYFRETRGQILAKLGRHEEALRELEAAMFHTELLPLILPTMISSCYKLGLETTAKEYEEKLRSLRAEEPAAGDAKSKT